MEPILSVFLGGASNGSWLPLLLVLIAAFLAMKGIIALISYVRSRKRSGSEG